MSKKLEGKIVHLDQARTKEQFDLMKRIKRDGVCPFCRKHLEKYHSGKIIEEDYYWVVTENMHPYEGVKVHLLFIYRPAHITGPEEIPPVAMSRLWDHIRKQTIRLKIKGATVMMRFGDHGYTGGSVDHLHVHLISGVRKSRNTEPIKVKIGFKKH